MFWGLFITAVPSEEPLGLKVTPLHAGSHAWPWAVSLCYIAGRQELSQVLIFWQSSTESWWLKSNELRAPARVSVVMALGKEIYLAWNPGSFPSKSILPGVTDCCKS